ncbi:hypothetical protein KIKIMORA_04250 [Brevundimonas phage vB_BpoS-Kikimora]|uniref:Uncharacterized protein n=1 Tax=Brevundimonas phage vB_BpoS-Kikimora TaxID=2948601 RepID=A0A9E7MRX2_9CAUD|nr:hypothetical protein KIKIMORA_04250 [Brevundimonas phage vB_BpoS-Kikimora]
MGMLGYCPHCGDDGMSRERRPDGNDTCRKGHTYPTSHRYLHEPTQDQLDAYALGRRTQALPALGTPRGALVYCVPSRQAAEDLYPLVASPDAVPGDDGVRVIPYPATAIPYTGRGYHGFRGLVVIRPQPADGITTSEYDAWVRHSVQPYLAPDAPTVIL